jgi:hypothetical protein
VRDAPPRVTARSRSPLVGSAGGIIGTPSERAMLPRPLPVAISVAPPRARPALDTARAGARREAHLSVRRSAALLVGTDDLLMACHMSQCLLNPLNHLARSRVAGIGHRQVGDETGQDGAPRRRTRRGRATGSTIAPPVSRAYPRGRLTARQSSTSMIFTSTCIHPHRGHVRGGSVRHVSVPEASVSRQATTGQSRQWAQRVLRSFSACARSNWARRRGEVRAARPCKGAARSRGVFAR